jgi:hypothetical protein
MGWLNGHASICFPLREGFGGHLCRNDQFHHRFRHREHQFNPAIETAHHRRVRSDNRANNCLPAM